MHYEMIGREGRMSWGGEEGKKKHLLLSLHFVCATLYYKIIKREGKRGQDRPSSRHTYYMHKLT